MNKFFYLICLLWIPFGFISGQDADNLTNYLQSSKEQESKIGDYKVFRNAESTYVKLKWDQNVEKASYTVILEDAEGRESFFQSTGTNITIKFLEVPQTYYWTVLGLEGDREFTGQFSTAYSTDANVSRELSALLKTWKGNAKHGMNLEEFLRENGQHIDPEELETFIYNFYEGVPPSMGFGTKTESCRCTMVASDDFILGGETTESLNHQYIDYGCSWWWRDNSYASNRGATKNMAYSLKGRLKGDQSEEEIFNNYTTATSTTVNYICDGEDCCGARIKYGLRYDSRVLADGHYDARGSFIAVAADMGFFSRVNSDNEVSMLGAPISVGVTRSESTTSNPEFWNDILDLIVPTGQVVLGVLTIDSLTSSGIGTVTSGLDSLIDEVRDLIGSNPLVQATSGPSRDFRQFEASGQDYFEPNDWKTYSINSSALMEYRDAWGRKTWCGRGYINVNTSVESGMAMAFSLTDENNDFPDNCCVDEKAKWLSHSYIDAGNAASMLATCGRVIGCNGIFDGKNWVHEQGFTIGCSGDNPVLVTASGTAKVEHDCCEDNPLNSDFEVSFDCIEGYSGGGGNDYDYAMPAAPTNGGYTTGGTTPQSWGNWYDGLGEEGCIVCSTGMFTFNLDCDDGNSHSIQIVRTNASGQAIVFEQDDINDCSFSIPISMTTCSSYTAYHTTYNDCGTETKSIFVVKTCCGETPWPDNDDAYALNATTGGNASPDKSQNVEPQYLKSMTVYPNPARNEVSLTIKNTDLKVADRVEIYTVEGKRVYSELLDIGTTKATLDISNLQNGLYFITIQSGNDAPVTKRLVIQK